MNVLSLFDGMSCGQIALKRAGVHVDNYFASEIDKHAIKVTMANYPGTIQMGDVSKIESKDLPNIDLVIGGSPCQGFSLAGKKLNFKDPRSALFFEYVRLLKECKPKYFLLENVIMNQYSNDVISTLLGELYPDCVTQKRLFEHGRLEPIKINSALVSAQSRNRLYWTNIKGIKQPPNKGLILSDIIDHSIPFKSVKKGTFLDLCYCHRKRIDMVCDISGKAACLTISASKGAIDGICKKGDKTRRLTPVECERLQTVPDNYTNHVSNTQRYKMLGNGWTVDVISHILKNMELF